ncbi:MAG: ribonuclease T2 [Phaeovulum sp.]|uniref:ribonuclease T2 n=1 Tax=Phaeovulum sp. TaxID=2934796 RepID=UPI00272EEF33|nr:ribonuclease T2 [Phaeovulum sp.]MDP2064017.1 ribonuclease T2 [Phaeovulum sp.]
MRYAIALLALLAATPGLAEGERAGDFDYYVLSLSWSPNWCALEGDARGDDQCDARHDFSFTLHGLWPQFETGWPSWCRSVERDPTRSETAAMADIMGGSGLAWYQWQKHGRCAGFSAQQFYAVARQAYESMVIPEVFRNLNRDVRLPALAVEEAFLEANPKLERNMITITCDRGAIQEARICLTKDLTPRPCVADTARDCRMPNALMEAVR